ncbi:MAG TPA: hypothetical protein VGX70_03115, partial [Gemmataceae bacterium]|nr:hypothetical protein [Gemmataceae bacterium]
MDTLPLTKVLSIRECGHDEYWLQDLIYNDPTILGLGDLEPYSREKIQSSGGRLDMVLEDQEGSRYEVEIQLGETNESHIIRTIEYWDNEKRRWPNRSHKAILVAEKINTRFFNVVQLLSKAVPIIGIQANIVQIGDSKAVHFTKVIDSYEEPEEEEAQPDYDEKYWIENYPGALECAHWYKKLLSKWYGEIPTKYHENYVSLYIGETALVWVNRRKNDRVSVQIKFYEGNLKEVTDYL